MKLQKMHSRFLPTLWQMTCVSLCAMVIFLSPHTIASESQIEAGLAVYKKANCQGCHKWHGAGGGGYGGAASSLRNTQLDRDGLVLLVRCGRPASGMPYHLRTAYRGDSTDCYGTTAAKMGDSVPSRARTFLRDAEINAVVDYVLSAIKGKGEPTREDCIAFWGDNAKQCQ